MVISWKYKDQPCEHLVIASFTVGVLYLHITNGLVNKNLKCKQKKKRKRKSLLRVSSLANLLSPKASRKSSNLTRSISFKIPNSPVLPPRNTNNLSPYKAPQPSPAKQRMTRTWSDMVMTGAGTMPSDMSHNQIKHQEAIYELYQGELDLIEDLKIVKKTYRDSMQKLQLMTDGELEQIFGPIDSLIPIHDDLVERLQCQRRPDGTTLEVGKQVCEWIPKLKAYVSFCANQVFGKAMLDEKKNDPDVDDFLQRCQESPFSRKLDLWGLLDGARGRFVKYPLLLKSIQKYTSKEENDVRHLDEAIRLAEQVIAEADKETGEAKCQYYRARLTYLYDDQKHKALDYSKMLLCNGTLKNNKGTKLQVFLFDKILVVTRLVTQNGQQCFQVYRDPIPVTELVVEDLKDGEVKMGSFRSAFSSGQISKNLFRISFTNPNKGHSHTLMANDEHDKRQWLQSFHAALKKKSTSRLKP
ncbi:hypothetical protein ACJMK2_016581 [Sinanodonta woodiana]|uniref:Rho guanine nucleotide exchange factor 3 n=1 Tax=Sinanodonta woodiana TaxID=1069815 RepID=A0ABD3UU27_SINWO